jgi:hypothetical protein
MVLGYCDAQCARDLKFVGGEANAEGWEPSPDDPNAGVGQKGACWYVFFHTTMKILELQCLTIVAPRWTFGKPMPSPLP